MRRNSYNKELNDIGQEMCKRRDRIRVNCLKCLSKHEQPREHGNCSRKTSHSLSANQSIRASARLLATSASQLEQATRFPESGTVAHRTCDKPTADWDKIKKRSAEGGSASLSRFIECENIPDSTQVSRSGVDTRLGVLQLGRLFAKDDWGWYLWVCCHWVEFLCLLWESWTSGHLRGAGVSYQTL